MIERNELPQCRTGSGVLIAVHGGPTSVRTIQIGLSMADRQGTDAAIVTVAPPGLEQVHRSAVERRLAEAVGGRTIPVYVVNGPLGTAIADVAEGWRAALVVIGMGIGAHVTAVAILRKARRCVLAVAPSGPPTIGSVILTADFGSSAVAADECALSLLAADADAELVHVVPEMQALSAEKHAVWCRIYDSVAAELLEHTRELLPHRNGHAIPTRVLTGDAARVLVDIAAHEHVDLIALGRHALPSSPGTKDPLGPVLESVLEEAPCSVLVAPASST